MLSSARIPEPVSPSAAAALAGRWRRARFLLLLNGILGALLVVALSVALVVWGAQARGGYSLWMWLGPLLTALCSLLVLPSRKELLAPDEWGGNIAAVFFGQNLVGMPFSHVAASPVIPGTGSSTSAR